MQRGILPLLPTKGGEGRGEEGRFYLDSPLPNPLPTRSSRGEGGDPKRQRRLIQWQCPGSLSPCLSRFRCHSAGRGQGEGPCQFQRVRISVPIVLDLKVLSGCSFKMVKTSHK